MCLRLSHFAQSDWYCHNCAPPIPADLESLSVRSLKDILQSRGVSVEDCVEKRDLIDKIKRVFILP